MERKQTDKQTAGKTLGWAECTVLRVPPKNESPDGETDLILKGDLRPRGVSSWRQRWATEHLILWTSCSNVTRTLERCRVTATERLRGGGKAHKTTKHCAKSLSTAEHCGQLDQTIFTTEKKERRIYSELRPDSDPADGNWESGGCFLVWWGIWLSLSIH